jgi:Ras-related protein Rab-18
LTHIVNLRFAGSLGVDLRRKTFAVDEQEYELLLWDTAGQEKFRSLTSSYYRGAHGIILVYDITSQASFDDIERIWLDEVSMYTDSGKTVKLLLGNKIDEVRSVPYEEGESLAAEHGFLFAECSSKRGIGINDAFQKLVKEIIQRGNLESGPSGIKVQHQPEPSRGMCASYSETYCIV